MRVSFLLFFVLICAGPVQALEWRGSVAVEGRLFVDDPADARQHGNSASVAATTEIYHDWDEGRQSLLFAPFVRLDQYDEQRSHGDIRELSWLYLGDDWELRIGNRKLFWGVTESQHLVDIINQTDLVEDPDGEAKLGQPMINLALIRDWGTLDLFVLPYFRERSFAGVDGRLRSQPYVATTQVKYESSQAEKNIDYAVRWAHSVDVWDIGLSYFNGTSRDPVFVLGVDGNEPVLTPFYPLIQQVGIDIQATVDVWLLKLEAIHRRDKTTAYNAFTAGFEYTLYGLFSSVYDLGLIYEYLYDSRNNLALTPFENDSMLGLRLAFNDVASTDILLGVIADHEGDANVVNLEASRRLSEHWKLSVRARSYASNSRTDLVYFFRRDSYTQAELAYFF